MTDETDQHQQQLHITGSVEVTGIPYTQPVLLTVTSTPPDDSAIEPTIHFQGISVQGSMQVSGLGENFIMNICINEETEGGFHQSIHTYSQLQHQADENETCSLCSATVHSIEQHTHTCVQHHIISHGHYLKGRASFIGGRFYYINLNCVSCPCCNEDIQTHDAMVSHLVTHHSALFDYICRLCPYTNDDLLSSLCHTQDHHL